MPVYCYENKSGDVIEKVFPIDHIHPKGFKFHGQWYSRSLQAEGVNTPSASGWPIECIGSGVHPDDAGALRQCFNDAGVPTEVSNDGNPIYKNSRHRKAALKCRGLHDKASYS